MARFEGGTAPTRLEWVAETTEGTTPADPNWQAFSYNVENFFNLEPDANTTPLRGVGSVKPRGHFNGSETHEATFEYSLARWFLDGAGNVQDPAYYAMDVNADNSIQSTLSVVSRMDMSDGGNDSAGRRTYVVGKGGHPSSVTLPFETEEGTPILVSLEMQFQKVRAYTIHQPSASTTLDIQNTGSTSVDVTIEDDGASTTETNTVSGGSTVTTTATYADIDAVELDTDTDGDVIISDGSGTTFLTVKGSDSYPAGEGDLGVPALGTGSHASAITEGSEVAFIGDTIDYNGTAIADEIESGELTVDLGLEDNPKQGTAERNIHVGEWEANLTASVAGEDVTESQFVDYLTEVENDIVWTTKDGETVTLSNSRLDSPGEFAPETGQAKVMLDASWMAEDISVSNSN